MACELVAGLDGVGVDVGVLWYEDSYLPSLQQSIHCMLHVTTSVAERVGDRRCWQRWEHRCEHLGIRPLRRVHGCPLFQFSGRWHRRRL